MKKLLNTFVDDGAAVHERLAGKKLDETEREGRRRYLRSWKGVLLVVAGLLIVFVIRRL